MEDGEIDDESAPTITHVRSSSMSGDVPRFAVGTHSHSHRPRYGRSHSDLTSRQPNSDSWSVSQRSQSQDYGYSQQTVSQRSQSQDYGYSQQTVSQRSQSQDYGYSQQTGSQRLQSQDYGYSQQTGSQRSQSQDYGYSQQTGSQRSQSQSYGYSQQNILQRSQSQGGEFNETFSSREPLLIHAPIPPARSPLLGTKPLFVQAEAIVSTKRNITSEPKDSSTRDVPSDAYSSVDSCPPKPPPVPQPPPPRHPCVEAFEWDAAALRVVYDGVPAVVRAHLERFIHESLLSKDYWNLYYSKNASDVDDWRVVKGMRVKYYPGLIEDRNGSSELLEQNPSDICDISVPWYSRVTNYALPFEIEGRQINGSVLSKCFNCGMPNHELRDCKMPRSDQDIEANRQEFNSSLPPRRFDGRYHIDGVDPCDAYKPGILTDRLRQALGMSESDPPPYLKKMRRFGFPPGYTGGYENEPVVFPGLNAPLPEGVRDPDVDDGGSFLGRRSYSSSQMSPDRPAAKRIKCDDQRDSKSTAKTIDNDFGSEKDSANAEIPEDSTKLGNEQEIVANESTTEETVPSNWAKIKRTLTQERGQSL